MATMLAASLPTTGSLYSICQSRGHSYWQPAKPPFFHFLKQCPLDQRSQRGMSQKQQVYSASPLHVHASAGGGVNQQSPRGGRVVREVLNREGRTKLDVASDRSFYSFPRLVKHVDDKFLETLTELYRQRIPAGAEVLDLMSSWVSHLPPEVKYKRVVGHGMNAAEMERNKRLDSYFIKDLNETPKLVAADSSFDAVLICVSVQYLEQPEKVFAEIYRVLKPGGCCIVSFSNRMFYEKAISAWREGSGYSRSQLVKQYFQCIEGFTQPEAITQLPVEGDKNASNGPLGFLQGVTKLFSRASSDPFYAVVAYRNFRPTEFMSSSVL